MAYDMNVYLEKAGLLYMMGGLIYDMMEQEAPAAVIILEIEDMEQMVAEFRSQMIAEGYNPQQPDDKILEALSDMDKLFALCREKYPLDISPTRH